jgi:hypothetical protein
VGFLKNFGKFSKKTFFEIFPKKRQNHVFGQARKENQKLSG